VRRYSAHKNRRTAALVYYNFSLQNLYLLHSSIPTNQPLVDMVYTKLCLHPLKWPCQSL